MEFAERRKQIQDKQRREADAESLAGNIIASRSAIEKAAHEEYNDPVAYGRRGAAEFVEGDEKAQEVLDYLREGEPEVQGTELEAQVLQKVVRKGLDADAEVVEPEPRADGLDVVKEQVREGQPVDNPKLATPVASTEANAGAKKDEKDAADARRSQPASARGQNVGAKSSSEKKPAGGKP